jgi:hypothetical protein
MMRRVVRAIDFAKEHTGSTTRNVVLVGMVAAWCGVVGCGGVAPVSTGLPCSAYPHQEVEPQVATADHAATGGGNQVLFSFPLTPLPAGCAQSQSLVVPTWQTSDSLSVSISNANDATNGVATCNATTTQPVTISTVQEGNSSVGLLTCR